MAKSKKQIPYNEAITELESILQRLRSGELGVDDLTASTKRAKELIDICRTQLIDTKQELDTIIDNTTL
ncbi:MAG: exodeoxyribonuclease VII small subunit [Alistipes sp.]|nr:exodeoxyribonuclease VII small subunit [Alistipes sp.]